MVGEESLSVDDPLCRGESIKKARSHKRRPCYSQHDIGEFFKSMDHRPTLLLLLTPLVGGGVGPISWRACLEALTSPGHAALEALPALAAA